MSPFGRIFRTLLLLVAVLAPIFLIFFLGWWAIAGLVAVFAIVAVTLVFSTGKATGAEENLNGLRTGYRTTSFAEF